MHFPESLRTDRLDIRRPRASDARELFDRYASDLEVTRYLAWPTHRTLADTQSFLSWCDRDWQDWNGGAYLMFERDSGRLVGGAGITVETEYRASTGYVLAKDAWGRGLATEALRALVQTAFAKPTMHRLYLLCHVGNGASARVAEKAGFTREGVLRGYLRFPNLGDETPADVICYGLVRGASGL